MIVTNTIPIYTQQFTVLSDQKGRSMHAQKEEKTKINRNVQN